jgi:hypothetical protein
MTTAAREYVTRDKSAWGPGPWKDEPDKVQWKDEATGLPCLIVRNRIGALCGYVGVPPGHPAFEVSYHDVEIPGSEYGPEVHGGLTYSDHCQHGAENEAICHVPEPGEPDDVWWLGFDCAHSGDYAPSMRAQYRDDPRFADIERGYVDDVEQGILRSPHPGPWDETYKTIDYVRAECASLAAQLSRAGNGHTETSA